MQPPPPDEDDELAFAAQEHSGARWQSPPRPKQTDPEIVADQTTAS